jgi:hypothetical protein
MGQEHAGLFSRIWAAFKCGILGKSMNRFSGSDEYWDRVIAAQLGWPQKLSSSKSSPVDRGKPA